ncbi:hypothetical protein BY996DRAFT_6603102 [Phakopsora pachyrhizi]|nr:hypothetical protein BY996DRAFT_6603102 [Phakopsora pachyrhizi]
MSLLMRGGGRDVTSVVSPVITVASRKTFIFLNVSTLRMYLAIELNMVRNAFKFELKHAIDSTIDCLLKIWKTNLARMGEYLNDCGQLSLSQIFRKHQEAEERQNHISNRQNIKTDSRQRNIQFSHSSPPQSLPSSTGSSSLAPRLPPKPSLSPTGSESIS